MKKITSVLASTGGATDTNLAAGPQKTPSPRPRMSELELINNAADKLEREIDEVLQYQTEM